MPKKEITKGKVTITLDRDLLELVRKHNLKLSTICNNLLSSLFSEPSTLSLLIRRPRVRIPCGSFKVSGEQGVENRVLKNTYFSRKEDYKNFLINNNCDRYATNLLSYLDRIFKHNITPENINQVLQTSGICKKYFVIAIRNFLNYCELNSLLSDELITRYRRQIKVNFKSKIDSFVPTKEQIAQSLEILNSKHPTQFLILYKAMLESGLRFTELKHIILTFDERRVEVWENKIAVYSNFYIRGKKSSYFVFISNSTYNKLVSILPTLNTQLLNVFQDRMSKDKEIISLKYLRKYQFTLLIEKGVSLEIANFIQGRASQNVGFNHYLSKKAVSLTEYSKILDDFY